MKIEILYPSCANLYGEATAVTYMRQCLPEAEFVLTELNDVPTFASEKVDMVFMGGLLQGIFPTQGSNPGLPHSKQTL